MQKVVGSSPISRFQKACKSALYTSSTGRSDLLPNLWFDAASINRIGSAFSAGRVSRAAQTDVGYLFGT
jgi:hypothetical protein